MASRSDATGQFLSSKDRCVFTEDTFEVTVPVKAFQDVVADSEDDLAYGASSKARTQIWLKFVAPFYLQNINGTVQAKQKLAKLIANEEVLQDLGIAVTDASFQQYLRQRQSVMQEDKSQTPIFRLLSNKEATEVSKKANAKKNMAVKRQYHDEVSKALADNLPNALSVSGMSSRDATSFLNAFAGKDQAEGSKKQRVGGLPLPLKSGFPSLRKIREAFRMEHPDVATPYSYLRWTDVDQATLYRTTAESTTVPEKDGGLHSLLMDPIPAISSMYASMLQTPGLLPTTNPNTFSNSSSSTSSSSSSSSTSSSSSSSVTPGEKLVVEYDLSIGGDGTPTLVSNRAIFVFGVWMVEKGGQTFFLKGRSMYIPLLFAWGSESDCRVAAPYIVASISAIINHKIHLEQHGVLLQHSGALFDCSDSKFLQLSAGVLAGTSQQRCPKCKMDCKNFDCEYKDASVGFTNYTLGDLSKNLLDSFHVLERFCAARIEKGEKPLARKELQSRWKTLARVHGSIAMPMLFFGNARARNRLREEYAALYELNRDSSTWTKEEHESIDKKLATFLGALDILDDSNRKGKSVSDVVAELTWGFYLDSVRSTPALGHGLKKLGNHVIFDWLFRVWPKLTYNSREKNNRHSFQRRCFIAAKPGKQSVDDKQWSDETFVKKLFSSHWYQKTTMLMVLNDRGKRKLLPIGTPQMVMLLLEIIVEQYVFTAAYSTASENYIQRIEERADSTPFYIATYIAAVYFLVPLCKSLLSDKKLYKASAAYAKTADQKNMIMKGSLWVHDLWHSLEFVKVISKLLRVG